jgi:hypothetical protein
MPDCIQNEVPIETTRKTCFSGGAENHLTLMMLNLTKATRNSTQEARLSLSLPQGRERFPFSQIFQNKKTSNK